MAEKGADDAYYHIRMEGKDNVYYFEFDKTFEEACKMMVDYRSGKEFYFTGRFVRPSDLIGRIYHFKCITSNALAL